MYWPKCADEANIQPVGAGAFGIGDIDGIEGFCSRGIFMSFIAQQSSFAGGMAPEQSECPKKTRYRPAAMMKMQTAMPMLGDLGGHPGSYSNAYCQHFDAR